MKPTQTMRAVVINAYRSLDAVEIGTVPTPQIHDDQVLVKVMAASVNSGDERIRSLNFSGLPMPQWLTSAIFRLIMGIKKPKKTLGTAFAGTVAQTGKNVTEFVVGDEVFAMTGFQFGAFAQYVAIKASGCITKKPTTASFAEAASLPFGGTTALWFLRKAGLNSGQRVLIYGATGAVGAAAVQIARAHGCTVTAVCGTKGLKLMQGFGAHHVIDYKKVSSVTDYGSGFDIVFDAVGHLPKSQAAEILAPQGRYVSVAGFDTARELKSDLQHLAELYQQGKITHVIDSTYPLADIRSAFKRVSENQKVGSVLVEIQP